MKFLICLALLSVMAYAAIDAAVQVTKNEVMCNCKSPYNKMYVAYQKAASETCKAYPAGAKGQASCIANALGYLSNFGRTFNHDAIKKDFESLPFATSCNPKLPEITNPSAWQWHGNFKYAEMDKSLAVYFACIDKAMEGDCNTQLTAEIRSCVTPSG